MIGGCGVWNGLGVTESSLMVKCSPLKEKGLSRPCLQDDFDTLVEPAPAFGERNAETLVDVGESAPADAELHPAVADLVQRGDLFGDTHRVGQGQQEHRRAQPDSPGAARDGAGNGDRRGQYPGGTEMVLGQPDRLDAQLLGFIHQPERLFERLVFAGAVPYRELQK